MTVNNPFTTGWPGLKTNEWLAENDGVFRDPVGVRYALQRSDDLVLWEDVAPPEVAAGTEMSVTDRTPAVKQRFYRVQMSR